MTYIEVATTCVSLTLAIAPVLAIWIKERAFTNRFDSAVKDSKPEQRAELIRAWGEAEKHPDGKHGLESGGTSVPKTAPGTESA